MTVDQFKITLNSEDLPTNFSLYLQALWYDAKGNWQKAHDLVDRAIGQEAAHIHAYLHRVEGDLGNARYWYGRAGQPYCELPLLEEWELLFHKFNN